MALHESAEMYLETIYELSLSSSSVRPGVDLGGRRIIKKSVSRAVGLLKQGGYLITDKDGFLVLTDSGLAIAQNIHERHKVLSQLLEAIGVDKKTAAEDACKIEHVISEATFQAIKHSHKNFITK